MGALGCMTFILCIMLSTGPAEGCATHPQIYGLSAPFRGVSVNHYGSWVHGCGNTRFVTPPFFNLSLGSGGLSEFARARSCPSGGSSASYALGQFNTNVYLPYHVNISRVYANFSYSVAATVFVKPGTCVAIGLPSYADCDRSAEASFWGVADMVDRANGSMISSRTVGPMGYVDYTISTSCSSGVCQTGSVGSPGTYALKGTVSFVFSLPRG